MDFLQRMQQNTPYCSRHTDMPTRLQQKAKTLCWQYNQTGPHQQQERAQLLQELLGSCHPLTFIEPSFRCDYGFNIHTHGLTVINYNCVILDTSPVHIGANAFIAPGVCLACAGHALDPQQRAEGIGTSGAYHIGGKCVDWSKQRGLRRGDHRRRQCDWSRQRSDAGYSRRSGCRRKSLSGAAQADRAG